MRRLSLGVVAGLCSMLAATGTANAAPMDFALSHLRVSEAAGCGLGPDRWCPDQQLFERLMLQFGTSMLPATAPAASLGVRGFYVGVDTTLTTINGDQNQWRRGSQGDARVQGTFDNPDASSVLAWNRVQLRKGLPFGLELDASLAQAASTQAWLVGVGVKWAIIEGFRTGIGQLPDVALRASFGNAIGTRDSSLSVVSVDLLVSKPFVVQRAWVVTPMLGLQGSWLLASSDLVDLTPEVDAFAECNPKPGHQLPSQGEGGTIVCSNSDRTDYANTRSFRSFTRFNMRLSAGAEFRYRSFLARGSLAYDLLAANIDTANDPEPKMSRQLSVNLGVGITF